jgi:uncharacterized protein YndB with AHSA1/START domain
MSEYGQLSTKDGQSVLSFERRLDHAPERVWRAVTEAEHLRAWFPTTIDGDRRAGGALRYRFENEPELPPMDGEMVRFDPPLVLEFTWGPDRLRIELVPDGDGTRLILTDVLEEHGKAARDGAGWHECLDLLASHLDDAPPPWKAGERWSAVHPEYVERFGEAASTIGPPAGHSLA